MDISKIKYSVPEMEEMELTDSSMICTSQGNSQDYENDPDYVLS